MHLQIPVLQAVAVPRRRDRGILIKRPGRTVQLAEETSIGKSGIAGREANMKVIMSSGRPDCRQKRGTVQYNVIWPGVPRVFDLQALGPVSALGDALRRSL